MEIITERVNYFLINHFASICSYFEPSVTQYDDKLIQRSSELIIVVRLLRFNLNLIIYRKLT